MHFICISKSIVVFERALITRAVTTPLLHLAKTIIITNCILVSAFLTRIREPAVLLIKITDNSWFWDEMWTWKHVTHF